MIASKANDHEGFYLLQYLLVYYSNNELQPNMRQIFTLLFQRLSLSKTTKYAKCVIVFFCFYAWKYGASPLVEMIEGIQSKLFNMVIERLFMVELTNISNDLDRKIVAVGLTKLLTDCPLMFDGDLVQYWPSLLQLLIEFFELPNGNRKQQIDFDLIKDDTLAPPLLIDCYQTAFSQLNYAQPTVQDFLVEIDDCRKYLANGLVNASKTRGSSQIQQLLNGLSDNHKQAVQKYCEQIGSRIF